MNRTMPRTSLPALAFFTSARVVFNTMYRMVYPFLGAFRDGLGVTLEQLSLVLTIRALLGVFGPVFASIGDSHSRRMGMISGTVLFILGSSLVVFFPTFGVFVLALILTMFGKYIYDPSLLAFLSDRFPYQQRGRVLALSETGWSLAFILGVPSVGFLIARLGWMAPFQIFALMGALILVGVILQVPHEPAGYIRRPGDKHSLVALVTSPIALNGLLIGLLISASNEVVNLVFGIWLEDAYHLKIAALGAATAVIGFSELTGELSVAGFVDRLGKPRAVFLGAILNSLAAVSMTFLGRTPVGAVVGLFFFYLTFEFTLVSSFPMMSELLPEARATMLSAQGASHSLGRALGAILAARLYTFSIYANFTASIVLNLIGLLALWRLTLVKKL